ncbi:MAG: hypothetical protein PHV17_09610 [Candidatus Omnitrophica bacterium]|nr:hypothetical protein [Candidatus Omnitrophota bacterium]
MFLFFLSNTIYIIVSAAISRTLIKPFCLRDTIIAAGIIFYALVVLTEELLGVFGRLSLPNILIVQIIVFLITVFSLKINLRLPKKGFSIFFGDFFRSKLNIFLLSVISGFFLVKLSINFFNPPFGWDCLNYHFTFPVQWLKTANLTNPPAVFGDPSPPYYPFGGSLLFFWFMAPFKHFMFSDLAQLPFFILSFLAVIGISATLGLNKKYAFYAACLFTLIPNYFKQLEIAYVDVIVSGLFLVALHFLLQLLKNYRLPAVFLFSLSTGLLLGVKTVALPYSALLIIVFLFSFLFPPKKTLPIFFMFIFTVIVFGGFMYIRNFLETSNFLYPFDFVIFGKRIFKGVMDRAAYGAHFNFTDYSFSKLLFHEGLGAAGFILILPAAVLGLPLVLIKKRKNLDFITLYVFSLPALIYSVYRFVIPLANTRYLYCLFAVSLIAAFYLLELFSVPLKVVKGLVFVCALSSLFEIASHAELIAALILSAVLFFLFAVFLKKKPRITVSLITISAFIVFLFLGLFFLERDYRKNEYARYIKIEKYSGYWPDATRAWFWLNSNLKKKNISYAGRPVPLPLYGQNLTNNVYYTSVNTVDPIRLHYFKKSYYSWDEDFLSLHQKMLQADNYRGKASFEAWISNLKKRDTDYLFVYSLQQTKDIIFPLEDMWAKDNPQIFTPVFENKTIHIYKVERD